MPFFFLFFLSLLLVQVAGILRAVLLFQADKDICNCQYLPALSLCHFSFVVLHRFYKWLPLKFPVKWIMSAEPVNLFPSEGGGRHHRHGNAAGEAEEDTITIRLNNYGSFPWFLFTSPALARRSSAAFTAFPRRVSFDALLFPKAASL